MLLSGSSISLPETLKYWSTPEKLYPKPVLMWMPLLESAWMIFAAHITYLLFTPKHYDYEARVSLWGNQSVTISASGDGWYQKVMSSALVDGRHTLAKRSGTPERLQSRMIYKNFGLKDFWFRLMGAFMGLANRNVQKAAGRSHWLRTVRCMQVMHVILNLSRFRVVRWLQLDLVSRNQQLLSCELKGLPEPNKTEPSISDQVTFSTEGLRGIYLPYGGGQNICPGRHYAKQEILLIVDIFLLIYDVETLVPKVTESYDFFGTGVLTPQGSTPFRICRRSLI